MANPADYKYEYYNVTFPAQYVAHVEINRPAKMNAFVEMCVHSFLFNPSTVCDWTSVGIGFHMLLLLATCSPLAFCSTALDESYTSPGLWSLVLRFRLQFQSRQAP